MHCVKLSHFVMDRKEKYENNPSIDDGYTIEELEDIYKEKNIVFDDNMLNRYVVKKMNDTIIGVETQLLKIQMGGSKSTD